MSTLAIEGSDRLGEGGGPAASRLDLALLALALPLFVVAGWPLLGYAVGAGAWLAQRGIRYAADRRASRALAAGDRRTALGALAAATLGRVWLVSLAVLLVGLAERESGLAAAILCGVLFTVYLVVQLVVRLLQPQGGG